MQDIHDLEVLIRSHVPIIVIETREEVRAVALFRRLQKQLSLPLFKWSVTDGIQRLDRAYPAQKHNSQPLDALAQIYGTSEAGIYLLLDFHPYLTDPIVVRSMKEIAMNYAQRSHTLVLISSQIDVPHELETQVANFHLKLPDESQLFSLIQGEVALWKIRNPGREVSRDPVLMQAITRNLRGLSVTDAQKLIRRAINNDGDLTPADIKEITDGKYALLNGSDVLSFENETAHLSDIGGMGPLKDWLNRRKRVFLSAKLPPGLHRPKGVMLLGVQGGGKSLAAKAIAGTWGVPLLRLDFGALYNKYIGETEKNIRQALEIAESMAPCVLWMDEIEKGIASDDNDTGTSKRLLGTLLTWMAEKDRGVFIAMTANDIDSLPPELLRKGRIDEIFFFDLPDDATRREIFRIHLKKREIDTEAFDLRELARLSKGFSGSEIEQAVVSALYTSFAEEQSVSQAHLIDELKATRPLSRVMRERILALRAWAEDRTVMAG